MLLLRKCKVFKKFSLKFLFTSKHGENMIQCQDCEFCEIGPQGQKSFKCDPFSNIKEPECITKWQLIRLDMLLVSYHNVQRMQEKFAPMQDKLFKYMQREIDDISESDNWKLDDQDEEEKSDFS